MRILNLIALVFCCSILNAQSNFSFTPTNFSAVFQGQAQIDGVVASSNDEIAAFDSNGNCCGSGNLIFDPLAGIAYINLTIYGDDTTTPIDEGINAGEDFTLMLYQQSTNSFIEYSSSFSCWQNTNGAPLSLCTNPSIVYNFVPLNCDAAIMDITWFFNLVTSALNL